MSEERSIPCFGGWLKVLCISPRMVMSCITQWSFQCVAFFKRSTSSFNLSRSTISDFLRMALFFFFGLDCSVTHSWEARLWVSSVRSMLTLGLAWIGDVKGAAEAAGLKGWGNKYGIWFPIDVNPWKNGIWGMGGRIAWKSLTGVEALGFPVWDSRGCPW